MPNSQQTMSRYSLRFSSRLAGGKWYEISSGLILKEDSKYYFDDDKLIVVTRSATDHHCKSCHLASKLPFVFFCFSLQLFVLCQITNNVDGTTRLKYCLDRPFYLVSTPSITRFILAFPLQCLPPQFTASSPRCIMPLTRHPGISIRGRS